MNPIETPAVDATPAVTVPVLISLADVEPEPIRWLWPGRIALGKVTLIAGDPGLGKSFLTLDLAARVSRGSPWPDDRNTFAPLGSAVILSAEDDLADTIRPRLDAAEADVTRIIALQAVKLDDPDEDGESSTLPFILERDLPALEATIKALEGCRLVVIDPITAYLGRADSHKNADIRGLLAPLSEIAGRHKVAVVAVTHLNKSTGIKAVYRTTGSLAFVAAARAVWAVTKDRENPSRRLFLPVKNNLGNDQTGLAYELRDVGRGIPCVAWDPEPVSIEADEALESERDTEKTDREAANEWLTTALADGPMDATDVLNEAKENGYTGKTVRRAAKDLRVVKRKTGFKGPWQWSLPAEGGQVFPEDAQDAHTDEVAIFGQVGHLRDKSGESEEAEWTA